MQQLDKIFLGITPTKQRAFLNSLFKFALATGKYKKVNITTCGEFHIVRCAIEAGFKKEDIVCSDISLFSSLLGFYYMGENVDKLGFTISDKYNSEYKKLKTETEKVAFVLWIMKISQLREEIKYEAVIIDELRENSKKHRKNFEVALENQKSYFSGITYKISDLRNEIVGCDKETIFVTDPPVYAKGYTKMFDFKENIEWECGIEEFDLKKEYKNLYELSKEQDCLSLWCKYNDVEGFDNVDIIFAEEKKDRFDYWLTTKPKELKGFKYKKIVVFKSSESLEQFKNLPIYNSQEIKEDSIVKILTVPAKAGLYYKELLCHRLGNSKAEHYLLILIDGRIFATVGLHVSDLFKLRSDKIFQVFGYVPANDRYRNLNRLLSYLLTCTGFKEEIKDSLSSVNRVYDFQGIKTTCLSRYKRVKANMGIFEAMKKEKLKDGTYKILYATNFHKRSFVECLKLFLKENEEYGN